MKKQFEDALEYAKTIEIEGCITGSCLLGFFEEEKGQDIDIFCYNLPSFTKIFYELYHNKMFTILDPVEIWKADMFMNKEQFNKHVSGVQTIKFMYNTCIPVNIVLKKNANNIFSVLSSFDLDIICKGYDLASKQYLDLSQNLPGKVATWNKWNPAYNSVEIWQISRVLRQLIRCIKYHKRGYNTDSVVEKYIELMDKLRDFENIFSSENFDEKLKTTKENTKIVREICKVWLETHSITEEQLEILNVKLKQI